MEWKEMQMRRFLVAICIATGLILGLVAPAAGVVHDNRDLATVMHDDRDRPTPSSVMHDDVMHDDVMVAKAGVSSWQVTRGTCQDQPTDATAYVKRTAAGRGYAWVTVQWISGGSKVRSTASTTVGPLRKGQSVMVRLYSGYSKNIPMVGCSWRTGTAS